MKTITKLATAALLTMSVVAPALAIEPEALTLAERNTYINSTGPVAQHVQQNVKVRARRGVDAMAQAPAPSYGFNAQYHNELNIQ
jgi:hypothetical protein